MPNFSADNYGDVIVKLKKDSTTVNSKKETCVWHATVLSEHYMCSPMLNGATLSSTLAYTFSKVKSTPRVVQCLLKMRIKKIWMLTSLWFLNEYYIVAFTVYSCSNKNLLVIWMVSICCISKDHLDHITTHLLLNTFMNIITHSLSNVFPALLHIHFQALFCTLCTHYHPQHCLSINSNE